jgi:hypothetical protein
MSKAFGIGRFDMRQGCGMTGQTPPRINRCGENGLGGVVPKPGVFVRTRWRLIVQKWAQSDAGKPMDESCQKTY